MIARTHARRSSRLDSAISFRPLGLPKREDEIEATVRIRQNRPLQTQQKRTRRMDDVNNEHEEVTPATAPLDFAPHTDEPAELMPMSDAEMHALIYPPADEAAIKQLADNAQHVANVTGEQVEVRIGANQSITAKPQVTA